MIKKKKKPNQTTQTYPIFRDNLRTHTDTKTNRLISLIPDSIGQEALPGRAKNRRADEEKTTESDDEQQQREGREGGRKRKMWEKKP